MTQYRMLAHGPLNISKLHDCCDLQGTWNSNHNESTTSKTAICIAMAETILHNRAKARDQRYQRSVRPDPSQISR